MVLFLNNQSYSRMIIYVTQNVLHVNWYVKTFACHNFVGPC